MSSKDAALTQFITIARITTKTGREIVILWQAVIASSAINVLLAVALSTVYITNHGIYTSDLVAYAVIRMIVV